MAIINSNARGVNVKIPYYPETCAQCTHEATCKAVCNGLYAKDMKWLSKDPTASKIIIKNGKLTNVMRFPKDTKILSYKEFMAVFTSAEPTCVVGTLVNRQDRTLLELLYGVA